MHHLHAILHNTLLHLRDQHPRTFGIISDTLTTRLANLEQEKPETELAIQGMPARMKCNPAMAEQIVRDVRALVELPEKVGNDRRTTLEDIKDVRSHLRTLLGTITLVRQEGTQ